MFNLFPQEISDLIIKYTDLPTLSKLLRINKYTYNYINGRKWNYIDNMIDIGICIPLNKETYNEYIYCIDFTTLIYNKYKIPDSVIIELSSYIDFELLSRNQKLSDTILYKFYDRIKIINLLSEQVLPYDLLLLIVENFILNSAEWHWICKQQKFDIHFINTYLTNIDWNALSQNKNVISLDILNTYMDKIVWNELTNNGISEDILVLCTHKFDRFSWNNISYTSKLSSEFILKYKEHLNIYALISCQTLEENVILELINSEEFYPKVDLWNKVASCQSLTKSFILKYKEHIQLRFLIRNKKIKRSILKDIFG